VTWLEPVESTRLVIRATLQDGRSTISHQRLSGGTGAVNRELEAKARALAELKGYVTNPRAWPDGTSVTAEFVILDFYQ
jgi:hypothetical protein